MTVHDVITVLFTSNDDIIYAYDKIELTNMLKTRYSPTESLLAYYTALQLNLVKLHSQEELRIIEDFPGAVNIVRFISKDKLLVTQMYWNSTTDLMVWSLPHDKFICKCNIPVITFNLVVVGSCAIGTHRNGKILYSWDYLENTSHMIEVSESIIEIHERTANTFITRDRRDPISSVFTVYNTKLEILHEYSNVPLDLAFPISKNQLLGINNNKRLCSYNLESRESKTFDFAEYIHIVIKLDDQRVVILCDFILGSRTCKVWNFVTETLESKSEVQTGNDNLRNTNIVVSKQGFIMYISMADLKKIDVRTGKDTTLMKVSGKTTLNTQFDILEY
jgi:hypothetical protein